jgi:hypothetical protein
MATTTEEDVTVRDLVNKEKKNEDADDDKGADADDDVDADASDNNVTTVTKNNDTDLEDDEGEEEEEEKDILQLSMQRHRPQYKAPYDEDFAAGAALANEPTSLCSVTRVMKIDIFQHCKVLHSNEELDDISPFSFGGIIMDKCNVTSSLRLGFWSAMKRRAKDHLTSLRQQVNTKLKNAFMSMFWLYQFMNKTFQHMTHLTCFPITLTSTEFQHNSGSFSLQHILRRGRKDKDAYKWFVDVYLSCGVVRGVKSGLQSRPPSTVYTICDEVLVLWFLESSWHVWSEMKSNKNTSLKGSTQAPLYTVPGDKSGSVNGSAGWTERGKERYNELFDWVEQERDSKAGKVFDTFYIQQHQQANNTAGKKKKKAPATLLTKKPTTTRNTLSRLINPTSQEEFNTPTTNASFMGHSASTSQLSILQNTTSGNEQQAAI